MVVLVVFCYCKNYLYDYHLGLPLWLSLLCFAPARTHMIIVQARL